MRARKEIRDEKRRVEVLFAEDAFVILELVLHVNEYYSIIILKLLLNTYSK